MHRCPDGHVSETDDFCDECGRAIASRASRASPAAPASPAPASDERCPWCETPRDGRFCEEDGYDFVAPPTAGPPSPDVDPHPDPAPAAGAAARTDLLPEPPPVVRAVPLDPAAPVRAAPPARPAPGAGPPAWAVRVEADRRYFALVAEREGPDFGSVSFPGYYPSQEIALDGDEFRIGRTPAPVALHIDLTGPPTDPGISRLHAVLLRRADGGWSVLDPGSTNGTTINYDDEPIATDEAVAVDDGDRIHVGAYTTLVLARATPSG